jgi:hypothetical protein
LSWRGSAGSSPSQTGHVFGPRTTGIRSCSSAHNSLGLLDDAFRVGEYIQAGRHKGTVEGFSIRSVRLRHHRGPVFTVPFNPLGAVENMSRDWVIDKVAISVTYDSDLEKARKLIKQIGLELQQDPEFGPNIIEPLKMQGVDELGEEGLRRERHQIRLRDRAITVTLTYQYKILFARRVFPCRGNQYDAGTGFRTGRHQYDADPGACLNLVFSSNPAKATVVNALSRLA